MKKRAYIFILAAALVALMAASGASAKKTAGFHGMRHSVAAHAAKHQASFKGGRYAPSRRYGRHF